MASDAPISALLLQLTNADDPLPTLRLLRNLCAGDPLNQLSFLRSGGPSTVASFVLSPSSPSSLVARVALQVLANVSGAGEEHASAVWDRMFPLGFSTVAGIGDAGVLDAVCMIVYNCCFRKAAERRRRLCESGSGADVVAAIVRGASAVGYRGDWLQLLLSNFCFEETCFSQLFSKLGLCDDLGKCGDLEFTKTGYTMEQAFLLEFLSEILEEEPYGGSIGSDFALSILQILKDVADGLDFSSRGSCSLPTGSPAIDVLGFSLVILKDICALDTSSSTSHTNPVISLLSSGICQFLLRLLRDLEPPLIIRKSFSHGQSQVMPCSSLEQSKLCPYKGFRRDIVAVIGNCMFGRKEVQDEIRRQNGILLLLQQCVIDDENPFLREWGIWAIRCLLEGNPENQKEVSDLEIQGSINTPEIAELGLRVEFDQKSRRAKLVNV